MAETTISGVNAQAYSGARNPYQQDSGQPFQQAASGNPGQSAQRALEQPGSEQVAASRALEANGQPSRVDPSQRVPDNTTVSLSREALNRYAAEDAGVQGTSQIDAQSNSQTGQGSSLNQSVQQQISDALGERALRATPAPQTSVDGASVQQRPTDRTVDGPASSGAADFSSYAAEYAANQQRATDPAQNPQQARSAVGNGVEVTGNQRSDLRR